MRFSRLSSMYRMRASALPRAGIDWLSGRGHGHRGQGQGEVERRALALATLGPDPATVHLDEALGEREPEPRASGFACEGIVETVEWLEEPVEIGSANPDAAVGDAHVHGRGVRPHGDPDTAGRRELD